MIIPRLRDNYPASLRTTHYPPSTAHNRIAIPLGAPSELPNSHYSFVPAMFAIYFIVERIHPGYGDDRRPINRPVVVVHWAIIWKLSFQILSP